VTRRRRRRPATRSAETPHGTNRSLINQPANPRSRRCPFPCRHSPLFASNSPVSIARDRPESPLPADDPRDSLLPPFVTRVARDNPPSPAPAPLQPRASSPISYPIRLPRSRRLRSLHAHRHARPRHVRIHRPRCSAPLATLTPGATKPLARTAPQQGVLTLDPLSTPRSRHTRICLRVATRGRTRHPAPATPPATAEIDRTGYRTGGRPRPRADQCRPPSGGRAGSLPLRPAPPAAPRSPAPPTAAR